MRGCGTAMSACLSPSPQGHMSGQSGGEVQMNAALSTFIARAPLAVQLAPIMIILAQGAESVDTLGDTALTIDNLYTECAGFGCEYGCVEAASGDDLRHPGTRLRCVPSTSGSIRISTAWSLPHLLEPARL